MSTELSEHFPNLFEKYKSGEISKAKIEDYTERVDEAVRPDIIKLGEVYVPPIYANKEGEKQRILLVRSPHMPELAFVVFGKQEKGTHWRIRIKYKIDDKEYRSRQFLVVCACCAPHEQKIRPGLQEGDPDEYDRREEQLRKNFPSLLGEVCRQHGVKMLFFRRANSWTNVYPEVPESVDITEADEYKSVCQYLYGDRALEKYLSWFRLCDSTGRSIDRRF